MATTTPRRVEIVLDFVCIHSYLGLTRFLRAAQRYREGGGEVHVTFRPFQLAPGEPATGRPLFEVHKASFGEAKALEIDQDRSFGAADGLTARFDRAVYTNTFDAHCLLAAAAEQGLAEQMAERLFRAYLTEGLNLGDAATLEQLAAEIGVQPDSGKAAEVRADLDAIRRLGVGSIPLFRFENGPALPGAQPEAAYLQALMATPAAPAPAIGA